MFRSDSNHVALEGNMTDNHPREGEDINVRDLGGWSTYGIHIFFGILVCFKLMGLTIIN